jgi:hypothetical protein
MTDATPLSAILILALALWVLGCASPTPNTTPAGGWADVPPIKDEDQIFTVTDAAIVQALDVFPAFDDWERQNAAALAARSSQYHDLAQKIRINGDAWIEELALSVATYQEAGDEESVQAVLAALDVLRLAIRQAQLLMK